MIKSRLAKVKNDKGILLILLILFIYICFPTNNSSLDAYAYASEIKYNILLFKAHHLLYNAFVFSVISPFKLIFENIDVLIMSKAINSIFLVLNLIVLKIILEKLKLDKNEIISLIMIAGFSYNSMRFGTENEAYIIPITFSLIGSLYFLFFLKSKQYVNIVISGFFAAIACLFHQIHFFWWFGLLLGVFFFVKKTKAIFLFSFTSLIVPIVYILVLIYYYDLNLSFNSFFQFIFHDYYTDAAKSEFGWDNIFMLGFSSVRTFYQVHPNIIFLLKKNIVFVFPIIIIVYFGFITLNYMFRKKISIKRNDCNKVFLNSHFFIFIFYLLFSFYAVGNVEFLVMIPVLISLSIFYKYKFNKKILLWFSISLFSWNFMYGLYPNNKYNFYNDEVLVDFLIQHPNDLFIVKNSTVVNHFFYKTGIDEYERIIQFSKLDSIQILNGIEYFYTDVIDKPKIFNRESFLSNRDNEIDFKNYKKELKFEYNGLYGITKIYKVYLE